MTSPTTRIYDDENSVIERLRILFQSDGREDDGEGHRRTREEIGSAAGLPRIEVVPCHVTCQEPECVEHARTARSVREAFEERYATRRKKELERYNIPAKEGKIRMFF